MRGIFLQLLRLLNNTYCKLRSILSKFHGNRKNYLDFITDSTNTQSHCITSPLILYDEHMVEILSWLPVKSLMRFKCVSKYWESLISEPSFVKLHLQHAQKNANLLLRSKVSGTYGFVLSCSVHSLLKNPSHIIRVKDLGFRFNLKCKYKVVGSCNGLVCLVGATWNYSHEKYWVRLWNPVTSLRSKKSSRLSVDWSYDGTVFGFGYDHLSDNYKVVAILFNHKKFSETQVKVCNIGTDSWRNIQSFQIVPSSRQGDGIYLNNTLNWLGLPNSRRYSNWPATIDELVIVSLDLRKETHKQLLLPCCLDEGSTIDISLGVLNNCLCFSQVCKRTHFVIWQMKEFGVENSWTQMLKVSYQDLQIQRLKGNLVPLCIFENGGVLIMTDRFQLILFNQRDDRVVHIAISNEILQVYAKHHIQSLVSPC